MSSIPLEYREDYQKIEHYCAFQEHCEFDVRKKLKERKIPTELTTLFIGKLRSDKFLDDDRYCQSFVNDHINIKRWGKQKIYSALKMKQLSKSAIENSLKSIPNSTYLENLHHLFDKKSRELSTEKDDTKKKAKIIRYLASNGYEMNLIYSLFD
jgi:regulatory protein